MKERIMDVIFILVVVYFCIAAYGKFRTEDASVETTYQVTCVDDVLSGIVVKKGDRYYRQGGIDSVWIPMQQCALEPIK